MPALPWLKAPGERSVRANVTEVCLSNDPRWRGGLSRPPDNDSVARPGQRHCGLAGGIPASDNDDRFAEFDVANSNGPGSPGCAPSPIRSPRWTSS